jgi:hypothetical protein
MISVERVFNSRCSCGLGEGPENSHWGVFVRNKYPSRRVIQSILKFCRVPQFFDGQLVQELQNEYLLLSLVKEDDSFKMRSLQIESGMQQEAVYLACTALGLGTCIHNLVLTERSVRILSQQRGIWF